MLLKDERNPFYRNEDRHRRYEEGTRSPLEVRDAFERDYGRIIHSFAFRRLQAKKQVIGTDAGDLHRTRLTHSMEVAQIARGIALFLNRTATELPEGEKIDISLVEAAGLAHDLGHPPFGHEGEQSLNRAMAHYGGFEGNAQTFRILTRLEGKKGEGLNLTRGLLLAVMKYPILYEEARGKKINSQASHPPKTSAYGNDHEAYSWALSPFTKQEKRFLMETMSWEDGYRRTVRKPFECSIIELADDIAYSTHDLEDAVNLKLVDLHELCEILSQEPWAHSYAEIKDALRLAQQLKYGQDSFLHQLKQVFALLISVFVNHITVEKMGEEIFSKRLRFQAVLPPELKKLNQHLKQIVHERVIQSTPVRVLAWKADRVVRLIFEAMMNDKRLLPVPDRRRITEHNEDEAFHARVVCDYIAGMTDPYALKVYDSLYGTGKVSY
ncbi:anti-phage deoxyguanosine triphosphatase [Mechercharimyces sp. CAU 1602]|uniref:anti-phage deoxyguanosine triphosphatase n=1 Tax=Mechercharimyces sp. CAU 1602 TaxID=2973933 RepID=UPI002161181D|nr:anti-phage deoxyguanosine triphosphatase [Mechercharimyces sp. CAU 1602]MCS1351322.1 anti-phage deoxyguanosine triphosphatase [Mechercharimyces sp. CAU 1602]